MTILLKLCFGFFVIFALHWQCIDCRGRGATRGRVSTPYKTKVTNSNGGSSSSSGSWFSNLFKGRSSSASKTNAISTANAKSAASFKGIQSPSHIGFAAYGNNYESNFHHKRPDHNQFRPMSHPYQSHFHPQTAVLAYHFMPSPHVHHIHHYVGGNPTTTTPPDHDSIFYDYRSSPSSSETRMKEPIMYDYKPPLKNETSSEEDEPIVVPNPNDVFIAGVENMLFYGDMKENQHQVVFVAQGSDGMTFEDKILSQLNRFESVDNHEEFYFPDVEFRFDGDSEPSNEDLADIFQMYKKLVDDGRC
ncbi:uncharacterized protein LOC116352567 [Contarinia nasturtii]|uniref:uncharacterized protein LOC116352567 n=1 Tax=Contarinia nasturtii TaxID=265458 RepID=UPI0012D3DB4D|nr:uncharacterized protein LOC116352567 [Contarinia nasturtii]